MTDQKTNGESLSGSIRPDTPPRAVLLVDELPLRRQAYASFLSRWASECNLSFLAEGYDSYKIHVGDTDVLILNGGSTPIVQLRLRSDLASIDLHDKLLVIISDTEEADQVMDAILMGARGFLPAGMSPELTMKALDFILGGGDFFPPSALKLIDSVQRGDVPD